MAGSSKSVNYTIRPCKSIERKMMCEMISRLTMFDYVKNYRYIGMGAKYFVDFSLLHKKFGISDMYSMEINSTEKNKKRFEFNKPFNCIKMMFGNASDILNSSNMSWKNEKNIIWLDYDGGIKGDQIQDVESCIGKVESGSVIFVSFNSDLGDKFKKASPKEKLDIYCDRIDNEILVKLLSPRDMAKEKIYQTTNKMFNMVVKNKILERNSNSVPEVLSTFAEMSLNQQWVGQRTSQLSLEEALEKSGLKRQGERRDQGAGGARTYKAWLVSLMMYDHKEIIRPDKFLPDRKFIEYHNDVIFQK